MYSKEYIENPDLVLCQVLHKQKIRTQRVTDDLKQSTVSLFSIRTEMFYRIRCLRDPLSRIYGKWINFLSIVLSGGARVTLTLPPI